MTNVKLPSIEDYDDPSTRDQYQQYLLSGMDPEAALAQAQLESRDNARTPMQWDGSENGGFTSGTPWLKTNPNTRDINVEAQRLETGHPKLIALIRSAAEETLLAFHNFSREEQEIPASLLEGADEVLLSSYDREGGYRGPVLRPYESVMFRMRKD